MASEAVKEKGQETSRHILAVAKEVFSEVGYEGAHVDEIARRAGVNKATIYYHIGDKETLYAEVIHTVLGNTAERISRDIRSADSPQEKLRVFIRNLARTVEENPQMPPLMMREIAGGGRNLPDIVPQDMGRIIGMLTEIMEEGRKKGVFVPATPFLVHFMVIGALLLYKSSAPIRARRKEFDDIFRPVGEDVMKVLSGEMEELILRALSTRPSPLPRSGREKGTARRTKNRGIL
jgi:TetR/AcrR family transcriptional regulator